MKQKNKPCNLVIKSLGESGEFEGYGSVFHVVDSDGDNIIKGAFSRSLAAWKARNQWPSLLWQHKRDEPIGLFTEIKEDDYGLWVKGQLLIEDDPLARRAYAHLKAGSLSGLSVGMLVQDAECDRHHACYTLKELDLFEISIVTFPANTAAHINTVKSMQHTQHAVTHLQALANHIQHATKEM